MNLSYKALSVYYDRGITITNTIYIINVGFAQILFVPFK